MGDHPCYTRMLPQRIRRVHASSPPHLQQRPPFAHYPACWTASTSALVLRIPHIHLLGRYGQLYYHCWRVLDLHRVVSLQLGREYPHPLEPISFWRQPLVGGIGSYQPEHPLVSRPHTPARQCILIATGHSATNENTQGAIQSFVIKQDGSLTAAIDTTSSGGDGPPFAARLSTGEVAVRRPRVLSLLEPPR